MELYTLFDLSPPEPGHEGRALVFVDGFLRGRVKPESYERWMKSFRQAGWQGRIVGLHWASGSVGGYIQEIAESFSAFTTDARANNLASAFSKLTGILEYWKRATRNASAAGTAFGSALAHGEADWGQRELRLAGFSLGARVIYEALVANAQTQSREVDSAWFYGGALSMDSDWATALRSTREGIANFYSKTDGILRWLYRLAEFDRPVGIGPVSYNVEVSGSGAIRNHDVTPQVLNHLAYTDAVAKFQKMP